MTTEFAQRRLRRILLWSFALLLAGLMFFDKPFAYVPIGPIYISDLVLLAGVFGALAILFKEGLPARLRDVWIPGGALLLFLAYEAVRTAADLPRWGKMALRDGVVWGYGLFALCIVILVTPEEMSSWVRRYRKIVPYFVLWAPVATVLTIIRPDKLKLPGTDVSLFLFKPGDLTVHLTGAGIVLILWTREERRAFRWLLLFAWAVTWFLLVNLSRSAMLASLVGLGVAMLLSPRRRILELVAAVVVVWLGFAAAGVQINVPERGPGTVPKEISAENLVRSAQSVYEVGTRLIGGAAATDHAAPTSPSPGEISATSLTVSSESEASSAPQILREQTARWRLDWWRKIVGYTVFGPYRWRGKGFGVNLADDDGFQVRADHGLRSPHNVLMTFLARSGVPGLALFLLFVATLLVTAVRSLRQGVSLDSRIVVLVLGYFVASLANACFDVYVENPMGGVWFWSLAGLLLVGSSHRPSGKGPEHDRPADSHSEVGH